jgi:chromate transporter
VPDEYPNRLLELAGMFTRLGVTAFGGPAAHIAMMHREVVEQRHWMSNDQFVDLVGATNLIPGPNSTEMTMHVGHHRAGWRGLILAGASFILPAAIMVAALAVAYVEYGSTPTGEALLSGIKPVVAAIVATAVAKLGSSTLRSPLPIGVALVAAITYLAGFNEIAILFGGAVVVFLTRRTRRPGASPVLLVTPLMMSPVATEAATGGGMDLGQLFTTFLKIGAVLYGSGYVLLAFLRADFVERLGMLTDQQLLDAVAIGQFTPGPVFTTATFVGYLVAGFPGAVLATIAIFAPGFVFVAALTRLLPHVRRWAWSAALLDGVNATAIGLMAGVLVELAGAAMTGPLTITLAVVSLALLLRTALNSAWLIVAGGVVGLLIG